MLNPTLGFVNFLDFLTSLLRFTTVVVKGSLKSFLWRNLRRRERLKRYYSYDEAETDSISRMLGQWYTKAVH